MYSPVTIGLVVDDPVDYRIIPPVSFGCSPQCGVEAVPFAKFGMSSDFHDTTTVDDHDQIRSCGGGQSVRDDHSGAGSRNGVAGFEDLAFGGRIEGRGRFVEQE